MSVEALNFCRDSILIRIAIAALLSSHAHAMCSSPQGNVLELKVKSCAKLDAQWGNQWALITVDVLAEGVAKQEYGQRGTLPRLSIESRQHYEKGASRGYYYKSSESNPCLELSRINRPILQETELCCDTYIVGKPQHPACSKKMLKFPSIQFYNLWKAGDRWY